MKITVKIKFDSGKQKIESFGNLRYLVHILSKKEEESAMTEFVNLMSRDLAVPPSRIHYKWKDGDSYIFEVD